jgi:hypothetical protein
MTELTGINKRTWDAIDELSTCADLEAEDEHENYHLRVHTAAMTLVGLGLDLDCLGELAENVIEMLQIAAESETETESIGDDFKLRISDSEEIHVDEEKFELSASVECGIEEIRELSEKLLELVGKNCVSAGYDFGGVRDMDWEFETEDEAIQALARLKTSGITFEELSVRSL